MISRTEILKGQDCPPELEKNLADLLDKLNQLRNVYGKPLIVNSGYRTPEHNAAIGGAKNSAHCLCMAADFADPNGEVKNFCMGSTDLLETLGLWMEDPMHTRGWIHLQTRPAHNRVFIP